MDDQHRLGAHARGLFVFVGPAAVVGERAAAEEFRIVGGRLIGEQHQDLAFDVHALEIVPMKFGRDDAVADEDRFGVELIGGLLQLADADEIVQPFERDGLVGVLRRSAWRRLTWWRPPSERAGNKCRFRPPAWRPRGRIAPRCSRWPARRREFPRRALPINRSPGTSRGRACVRPKCRSERTPGRLPAVPIRISS